MKLFSVSNFPVSIEGEQTSGWSASDSNASRKILFNFEVEELENDGGFLLLCSSADKKIYADTWHETIEEAFEVAESEYKISRELWKEIK
jgi:hypothetical protein